MTAVPTWTPQQAEHQVSGPASDARDPLDDARHHFPIGTGPSPYARFDGRLPPLRLPAPPHGPSLHTTLRRIAVLWMLVDLSAFVAALHLGSGSLPLGGVALLGAVALSWHVRTTWHRRRAVERPPSARSLSPVLRPGSSRPPRPSTDPARSSMSRGTAPAARVLTPIRARLIRLPQPSALAATASVLAGLIIHLAINPTGL